jgi:UDP-3-O-[3-hydroxymyristoyl] glucosamine N-acyltransferase
VFGRPAHIAGSPAPAVGAAHQMLSIGKMLSIGQMLLIEKMLPIGQMLLIGKMLSIGQMLLIGRMLLILHVPAVGAAPHDTMLKCYGKYS